MTTARYFAACLCAALALTLGACAPSPAPPAVITSDVAPLVAPPETVDTAPPTTPSAPATVTVYYPTRDLEALEPEERAISTVTTGAEQAEAAVGQLLAGPNESDLVNVMPTGLKLRGVTVDGTTATVDLSKEWGEPFQGGSNTALLAAYAIVNTVTDVPGLDAVRFTVEGQPMGDFAGVLDLSEPLSPDPELNREDAPTEEADPS
ncbi:MAG TPA: spore gernimation protein [Armatimonadetes bacterium]|nr:spore gernimation protein [Armatimonadota bacterium]